MPAEGGC